MAMTGATRRPPSRGAHVVDRDGRLGPDEQRWLAPPDRTVTRGFSPTGAWDLRDRVCVGPVADAADAAAALLAAARGALLVVGPLDDAVAPAFLDDLRRLAYTSGVQVTAFDPASSSPDGLLDALLAGLADGLGMAVAARQALMSVRTAHRRLADARRQAGVTTTAALVAEWARDRSGG